MKNKLSVAMLVSQFPNIVQTYILTTISGLQNNNSDITIVASTKPQSTSSQPKADQQPNNGIIYLNTEIPYLFFGLLKLPLHSAEYWGSIKRLYQKNIHKKYDWKYLAKALVRSKISLERNYDLIHSHNLALSYDYLFLKDMYSIPIITTFHGKEPKGSKTLSNDKQKTLFISADLFLVNTVFAQKSLIELGCPEDKIEIIPQGLNIINYPFKARTLNKDGNIKLITVSRLSVEKGHEVAIHSIALLSKIFPNIEYRIVGDGPYKSKLQSLVNSLNLNKHVTFVGVKYDNDLLNEYHNASIFILPSISNNDGYAIETQGVVLQEAQACGLPVIGSKTGGIPYVINHGETGFLFSEGDSIDLTSKITLLIENSDIYTKLSMHGRSYVENNFDIAHIAALLHKAYKKAMEQKPRSISAI